MPDRRQHRGPHPQDAALFAPERLGTLRAAVHDLGWLFGRGYAPDAALKLVGDHHQLTSRQRSALTRAACSDAALAARRARRLTAAEVGGRALAIDGFNCCITLEVALSGGVVLVGRDGAHRDLASVHGSYRRVLETPAAIELLLAAVVRLGPAAVTWFFDRPVSNSGRLAALVRERSAALGASGAIELVDAPDRALVAADVAASSDSWVLERARGWFDLPGAVIAEHLPGAWLVDLSDTETTAAR